MDKDISNENMDTETQNEDVGEYLPADKESQLQMNEETNENRASDDEDDTTNGEEESLEEENVPHENDDKSSEPHGTSNQANKTERGKKRRKPANRRKNIRKVLKIHQLDSKTLDAQKEEQERLYRLELQRELSNQTETTSVAPMTDTEEDNLVDNTHPILILDDGDDGDDDDDDEDDDSQSSNDDLNIHSPDIILISSSDSEVEVEPNHDESQESDSSVNYPSTANVNGDAAGIVVNRGHLPDEPDILLPPQIAKVIKSHQILGVRFLYENLIESIKNFNSNLGLGCILAHAMGLGKTIQTISLIHIFLRFTQSKKVLVLVPINTLQNWLSEFDMWVPEKLKDGCSSNESKCENVTKEKREDEESRSNIVNDKDQDLSNASDNDISTQSSSSEPNVNPEMENSLQVESEEMSHSSSVNQKFNDEKIDIEYRDYGVFIINDSQKTTASRAKIVDQWHTIGGVLIMGYEMFRIISLYKASLCNSVTNAKGKKRKKAKATATVIDIEEEEKEMELMLDMQKALCEPGPDLVVCDEGHRIKNHQSNIHHALHRIRTRKRLVLTGYPLQNNLTEYWCMVDFVRPNYLGSRQEFQNMFERPIINGQCIDSTAEDKKLMKYRAHVLSSLLRGFVQRRDYTALKVALPPKEEHIIMVRMSPIQEAIYRRFLLLMQEGYGEQLNPIKIFAVCSKIWNHPDMLYKAMIADQSKNSVIFDSDVDILIDDAMRLKNSSKQMQNEVGFSPFANDAKTLLLKITNWAKEIFDSHGYVEGLIENGGKLVILMELIKESLAQGDKMLIFSQSLLTLDLIEDVLNRTPISHESTEKNEDRQMWRKNVDYFRIDGNTSSSERERLIEIFNRKENHTTKLFLLSTRAGCLGINLVGANRVVVFDVSWNPCHDAQAVCRVYRYGQQKPCYIYRLIASNTMEKRMYYRQISKQGVSDRVVDEMNPVENFSKDELTKLLSMSWDNEPQCDFADDVKLMTDSVLKQLCLKYNAWIVTLPFQHESLLLDQTSSKLSSREKREAKKDYEDEKRKAVFGMNGLLTSRASPYSQRQNIPIPDIPHLVNHASSSIQDQLMQNRMLPGQHTFPPRAAPTVALSSILRHVQQLRTEDSSAAHFRLLNSLNNEVSMQNVLYHLNLLHSANSGHLDNSTATVPTSPQTPNNAHTPGSISSMQQAIVPATVTQHSGNRVSALPVNQGTASDMGDNVDILLTCDSDQRPSNSLDSQPQVNSEVRNQLNELNKSINSTEVICIDSDGDNE